MSDSDVDGFLSGLDDDDEDVDEQTESDDSSTGGFLDGLDDEPEEDVSDDAVDYKPVIHFKSSENMEELDDNSVDLIVTSPPYNADWAYGSHDDQLDYETEYLPMLARVFKECWRVLSPSGRLVVNVPTLLRGGASGGQAILSDIDTMLNEKVGLWGVPPHSHHDDVEDELDSIRECMEETEFVHREWITWNKGFNTDGLAPNGSFPRPVGVLLNNMHEGVSVYQKPGDRDYDDMDEKRIENSKIQKWTDDLCDDVWDISPDSWTFSYVDGEDVPPFPEELVKRCIALWTYEDDTVLDPFAGRFTVGKVAKQMDRHSVGYELREELEKDIKEYTGMSQTGLDKW